MIAGLCLVCEDKFESIFVCFFSTQLELKVTSS